MKLKGYLENAEHEIEVVPIENGYRVSIDGAVHDVDAAGPVLDHRTVEAEPAPAQRAGGHRPAHDGGTWRERRGELVVRDIMTPRERLEVLHYADLVQAEVGHVVATLKHSGRQHALVTDFSGDGKTQAVRGIFSTSQIARQLGMAIHTTEVAQTFAEIGAALRD